MTRIVPSLKDPLPALPPTEGLPENPRSPVRRLIEALFRGKALVILLTMVGAVGGVTVGIIKPNEYVSGATFLYRLGSEQVTIRPGPNLPRGFDMAPGVTENAPHLLMSPILARRVVDRVGVEKIFQPFHPSLDGSSEVRQWIYRLQGQLHERDASGYSVEEAIDEFLGNLSVSNFNRGQLLGAAYRANDPYLAREILSAYVDEAVKFHLGIYSEETAIKIVQADFQAAKQALDEAQKAFDAIVEKSGLTNFQLQFAALQDERNKEVTALKVIEEVTIPELKIRIREGEKSIKTLSPVRTVEVPVAVPNPLIQLLTVQVLDAEEKLGDVQHTFQGRLDAPEVVKARQRFDDLRKRLAAEKSRPTEVIMRESVVPNETYMALRNRVDDARVDLAVQRENVVPKQRRVKALQSRVDELAAMAGDYARLQRNLLRRTDEFEAASLRLSQTENKQRLAANDLSTLKLVGGPTLELKRVGPKRGMMALMGLVGGLGMAFVIIALRALTDTTIRTPEELEQLLGVRVLATVPELRRKHVRRHEGRLLSGC